MTREETQKILLAMAATYPNYHPVDKTVTINIWTSLFRDYDFKDVERGLQAYIMTDSSGFAPSPGQIVEKIHAADEYLYPDEMEAWGMVRKAINDGCYHSEERFNELPEIVRKAVGRPGQLKAWSASDVDTVETVTQSNFLRAYRAVVARAKAYERMPMSTKQLIDQVQRAWIEQKPEKVKTVPVLEAPQGHADPDSPYWEAIKNRRKA